MGLPIELWDHIFSMLWDDPRALFSCCLSCRYCRRMTKKWIHKLWRVELESPEELDIWIDRFRPSPDIAKCLRVLWIRLLESQTHVVNSEKAMASPVHISSLFSTLPLRTPNLEPDIHRGLARQSRLVREEVLGPVLMVVAA